MRNHADSTTEDPASSATVLASLLADGVYVPFDRVCVNAAHTDDDIDLLLDRIERALEVAGLVGV